MHDGDSAPTASVPVIAAEGHESLDETSMRSLEAQNGCEHPGVQIALESASQPWVEHTAAAQAHFGLPASSVAAAQLQAACSSVLGSGHAPGAAPLIDAHTLLLHSLVQEPTKAAAFASALMQLPGAPLLWPAFGVATHGTVPQCLMIHAVRCMLAAEHPAAFQRLMATAAVDAVIGLWLRSSLLGVFPAGLARDVAALAIMHGPLVLVAVTVVGLGLLDGGLKALGEEQEVAEWLRAAKLFDVDAGEVLFAARAMEARHRSVLLPVLMAGLQLG